MHRIGDKEDFHLTLLHDLPLLKGRLEEGLVSDDLLQRCESLVNRNQRDLTLLQRGKCSKKREMELLQLPVTVLHFPQISFEHLS